MAENRMIRDGGCKEAVCIDAGRVYDSCGDKDCAENMRVYFCERDQMLIERATGVRPKKVEVINTYIDVESLPFNRGYYSCDLTFFFEIRLEVFSGHGAPCAEVCGVSVYQKKVILYGSEGNVKVVGSEYTGNDKDAQDAPTRNMCAGRRPGHPERKAHGGLRVQVLLLRDHHPRGNLQPLRRQLCRSAGGQSRRGHGGSVHDRAAYPPRADARAGL